MQATEIQFILVEYGIKRSESDAKLRHEKSSRIITVVTDKIKDSIEKI